MHCTPTAYHTVWVWPFCTKGNSPHHPYLLSPLCELTFCTSTYCTVYCLHTVHCVPTAYPTVWVDLFALTPTAHCVPTAYCAPTAYPTVWVDLFALTPTAHCVPTAYCAPTAYPTVWVWPFCTYTYFKHTLKHSDPLLEETWDQRQRSPVEGTWDQWTREEMTSYRDPPPLWWTDRYLLKKLPCSRFRLLVVNMQS